MDFTNFDVRYAPKSVADIVFANGEDKGLIADIVSGAHPFPAFGKNGILLYGINGTGKSALAKLLPNAIEVVKTGKLAYEQFVHVQVGGSNGADVIERLHSRAMLMPFPSHHYFVLDEVDNLTDKAMLSLKSLMNMPQTIFVLTTNNFSKIELGVRDRCHCIAFNAAPPENWLPLARRVLADAGICTISDEHLVTVIGTCSGTAREIVNAIIRLILKVKRNKAAPALASSPVCVV